MGISTSTGTLTAGQSRTFNLSPASAVTLTLSPNVRVTITETPATVAATGLGGNASRVHEPRLPGVVTYGPYPMGGSVLVEVESNSGSSVGWVYTSAAYATDSSGNVTGLVGPDGVALALPIVHSNCLFHGCARLHTSSDPSFMNMTGGSDASFAASLARTDAWASVANGFVATLNVANGNVAVPAPNFDYNAGEKLLVVWVGQMTPEGADTGIMGTSGASSLKGVRIRAKTTGELNFVLYDSVGPVSLFSNTTTSNAAGRPFVTGETHSFAVWIDGDARTHTIWVDEAINKASAVLGAAADCDTLTSSPWNIGCTTTGGTDCAVVNTSVFALFKWTAAQAAPDAADITEVLKQIRKNPTRLVLAGAM